MKVKVKNACAGTLSLPELKLGPKQEKILDMNNTIWNYFNLGYIKIQLLGEDFTSAKSKRSRKEN